MATVMLNLNDLRKSIASFARRTTTDVAPGVWPESTDAVWFLGVSQARVEPVILAVQRPCAIRKRRVVACSARQSHGPCVALVAKVHCRRGCLQQVVWAFHSRLGETTSLAFLPRRTREVVSPSGGNIGNANRGFLALVHVSCVFVAHERNAERAELALDVARIVSRFLFVSSSQVAARIWSPSVSSRGIGVGHGAEAVGICIH